MSKKKILVTGSLGYIGSVLTPYLVERGYDVLGFDIGFFESCKLYEHNDTKFLNADMRNFEIDLLKLLRLD